MQEQLSNIQIVRMMIALNKGIIPLDIDITKALNEMNPEDARTAKRKYRKLVRKYMKCNATQGMKSRTQKRAHAKQKIRHDIVYESYLIVSGNAISTKQ